MSAKKTIVILIIICMLLAACGQAPAVPASSVPVTGSPSPAATDNIIITEPGRLYNGFHPDTLLVTLPVISEADQKVFNPSKVYDYLATSPDVSHDYTIKGAELKGEQLYLTIEDTMVFENPQLALDYLKTAFSLSDKEILALPEFSGCNIDSDGFLVTGGMRLSFKSRVLEPIPVSANSELGNGLGWDEFLDYILGDNTKNDALNIESVYFTCSDTEITGIIPYYGWAGLEGYNGNDDIGDAQYAGDDEWGLLPGSVPEISKADLKTFDPEITEDYLVYIADHDYSIKEAELKDGFVYLTIEDSRFLYDISSAYDFFKFQFSLSDSEILALPVFSDCVIRESSMYIDEETWKEFEDGAPLDEINYFSINDKTLDPFPLSKDARISLLSEDTYERYELSYDDFVKQILGGKTKNSDIDFYFNTSFKYENGMITAVYEYDEYGDSEDEDYDGEEEGDYEGDYEE